MHAEISRRQFLARGGTAALGVGLAGSLLAGCGGGGGGGGQVTYWSNLEGSGPQAYFKKNIEKPFEKANQGTDLKVTFQPPTEMDRLVRTALQGGEGPDIIMTPGPHTRRSTSTRTCSPSSTSTRTSTSGTTSS